MNYPIPIDCFSEYITAFSKMKQKNRYILEKFFYANSHIPKLIDSLLEAFSASIFFNSPLLLFF